MRLRRKLRRSTKQYIIVSLICICVIGGAAILTTAVLTGQIREEYRLLLNEAYQEAESNQRDVYVAIVNIGAGDYITENKLEKMRAYSSQPEELFITEDYIGQMAIIDIPAGTQVLTTMLAETNVSSELRELEYRVVNFNSNIVEKDTVDIRICYPNGESYIILSKKTLVGYEPETATCSLWLDEEEQLRMSAAIVDAALYTGAYLYVTKYIEPNIQGASIANYTPSLAILTLMETDPNILVKATNELGRMVRKQLENRLAMSMGIDVSKINWDIDTNISMAVGRKREDEALVQNADSLARPEEKNELAGGPEGEKKSDDFNYFIEEEKARESDIEYGE